MYLPDAECFFPLILFFFVLPQLFHKSGLHFRIYQRFSGLEEWTELRRSRSGNATQCCLPGYLLGEPGFFKRDNQVANYFVIIMAKCLAKHYYIKNHLCK